MAVEGDYPFLILHSGTVLLLQDLVCAGEATPRVIAVSTAITASRHLPDARYQAARGVIANGVPRTNPAQPVARTITCSSNAVSVSVRTIPSSTPLSVKARTD
jgi:hypothetical protein